MKEADIRKICNLTYRSGASPEPLDLAEQFSHFVFLKLLDEYEEEGGLPGGITHEHPDGARQPLFPGQTDRFRWRNWCSKKGQDLKNFVASEVFPFLASTDTHPLVSEYFYDADCDVLDEDMVEQLVEVCEGIDIHSNTPEGNGDFFNRTLLTLTSSLATVELKSNARYLSLATEMLAPTQSDDIYDPACGMGSFLVEAIKRTTAAPALPGRIVGEDVSSTMTRIATVNLLLHGVVPGRVVMRHANVLADSPVDDNNSPDPGEFPKFSVVVAQPSFNSGSSDFEKSSDSWRIPHEQELHGTDGNSLFLAHAMRCLKEGGRCAIVLPRAFFEVGRDRDSRKLRRELCENFEVLAVVELPDERSKVQPAGPDVLERCLVVFRRPGGEADTDWARVREALRQKDFLTDAIPSQHKLPVITSAPSTGHVWFYRIDESEPSDNTKVRTPVTMLSSWEAYRARGFKGPPGIDATELASHEGDLSDGWHAEISVIATNNYRLDPRLYQPVVSDTHDIHGQLLDPLQLVREARVGHSSAEKALEIVYRMLQEHEGRQKVDSEHLDVTVEEACVRLTSGIHQGEVTWLDSERKIRVRRGIASFGFGKYRGVPLQEVLESDRNYLEWVVGDSSDHDELVKSIISDVLQGKVSGFTSRSKGDIPYARTVADLSGGLDECSDAIPRAMFKRAADRNRIPKVGDVLLTRRVMRSDAQYETHVVTEEREFAVGFPVTICRPDSKRLDSKYLAQVFSLGGLMAQIPRLRGKTLQMSTATVKVLPRFSTKELGRFKFPLPPLERQRALVVLFEQVEQYRQLSTETSSVALKILRAVFGASGRGLQND